MSKYLISTVETYRVDSETEVARIIEDAKNDSKYELVKYSSTAKETKQKGHIYSHCSMYIRYHLAVLRNPRFEKSR
jgi:hypothetical protein